MTGPLQDLARIDLHTHSNCSDGALSPTELVALAAARGVQLLALTDHDTLAGLAQARSACQARGVRFLPGVELSCQWQGREIHIVGLNVDAQDAALTAHCREMGRLRRARIEQMAQRLDALGLPGTELAATALRAASPTRSHLARALQARGLAPSVQQAFERYLAPGRPAYVPAPWPPLDAALEGIRTAGGLAVLAHPHRYGLTAARLAELAGQFRALGGAGVEVSLAGMSAAGSAGAAALARRFDLAGSIGSDFHEPGLPWRPLGRFAKLPAAIRPITASLEI